MYLSLLQTQGWKGWIVSRQPENHSAVVYSSTHSDTVRCPSDSHYKILEYHDNWVDTNSRITCNAETDPANVPVISGEIFHENYANSENIEWNIASDCERVRIWSTKFDTEAQYDFVTIEGIQYSGTEQINLTIEKNNFIVRFQSDTGVTKTGFVLSWTCAGWLSSSKSGPHFLTLILLTHFLRLNFFNTKKIQKKVKFCIKMLC